MKKYIYTITFLILLLTTTSCDSFLDVKPAGRLIPEKGDVASFEKLLNHEYTTRGGFSNNNNGCLLNYLTDDLMISDNQGEYFWTSSFPNLESYYGHIFKIPYFNPKDPDYYTWWMDFYRPIEYFNVCIDGVKDVMTPNEEQLANETIAQAKVARAYLFFNLGLIYGPVYNPKGTNNTKTIPMRTQSNVLAPMEDLATSDQVFAQVLKDVHASLKHMPEYVGSPSRFGKSATYAFLSHYHLFTQNFDSVAYYADKALTLAASQKGGIENLFYDYNKFSWADATVATDPDRRASSQVNTPQGSTPLTATYHNEILLFRKCANASGGSFNYPSTEFIALFDENQDLRREYLFFEHDGYKTKQGEVMYDDGRRIINFQTKRRTTSGYTYPELLLMRAEGRARSNDLAGAVADLNLLWKFRLKPGFTPFAASSQDEVINEVLNERRRELSVGSTKRFLDLKRLVLDIGKPWCKETITHTLNGKQYSAKVDSEYFIMPIQNDVILKNPQWGVDIETRPWSTQK